MSSLKMKIDDCALFEKIIREDNFKQTLFLSSESRAILNGLFKANDSERNFLIDSPFDDLMLLWQSVLADAIHTLKVFDPREKGYSKRELFFPSNSPSDAYLKVRDEARSVNVVGINPLLKYFTDFAKFEDILYGSEPHYRDHLVHSIRVWLTGIAFLLQGNNLTVIEITFSTDEKIKTEKEREKLQISGHEKLAMWSIMALCHDLGYPLEKTFKINNQIEKMLSHFGSITTSRYQYSFQAQHHSLIESLLKIISSRPFLFDGAEKPFWATKVQPKFLLKFAHSLEDFKHGIISCLVLLKSTIFFLETDYSPVRNEYLTIDDVKQFLIRREILRSIAGHTCGELYHVGIKNFPFLLQICDELQEWDRPTFAEWKDKEGTRKVSIEAELELKPLKDLPKVEQDICRVGVVYSSSSNLSEQIKDKFRLFHTILRPSSFDQNRAFFFRWDAADHEGKKFHFEFDSSKPAFEEFSVEPPIFNEKK